MNISDTLHCLRRFWHDAFSRGKVLTTLIVASNIAVFLLELLWHYYYHSGWFHDTFAISRQGLAEGHYWQLLSYAWIHYETRIVFGIPIHITWNMMMIYILGRQLELPLGPVPYLILYIGSVLAAMGFWFLLCPRLLDSNSQWSACGASGALYGLVGAFGFIDPKRVLRVSVMFGLHLQMSTQTLALLLIGIEVLCQVRGWMPDVCHLAHLGGALFGLIFILIWKQWPFHHSRVEPL